jgi:hypothetical protein
MVIGHRRIRDAMPPAPDVATFDSGDAERASRYWVRREIRGVTMAVLSLGRGRSSRRAVAFPAVAVVVLLTLAALPSGSPGADPSAAQTGPANQAATSAAALAADPTGFDHAFYRGQDGAVYQRTLRDGVWSAETSIGGRIVGAPSAALAQSSLVAAARGTDAALWLNINRNGT